MQTIRSPLVWVATLFAAVALCSTTASAHALGRRPGAGRLSPYLHRESRQPGLGTIHLSSAVYRASEDVGRFAVTVVRSNDSGPETFYYGVTNKSSEAGTNFQKVGNTRATFAPGQSIYTFYVTIDDQGINGPMRTARAYIFGGSPAPVGSPADAQIDLLQNDPLAAANPENALAYAQAPTDGDPLQHVRWYVFGDAAPSGVAASQYEKTNPAWAQALHKLAFTPGSGSYRFWMWNQPASSLAATVERYLANAEQQQPDTTVPLTTYSLVHGSCENPFSIQKRYETWIRQLATGIGNFRVVLYLEEDSLMETHCLNYAQLQERLRELRYAVTVLSRDPHLLIYMDAGAPDGWLSAAQTAALLRKADIAQAQGFFVNATHNDWTTTDVHFGQEIAKLTGGKHFIVQTDNNGRGPLVPADRAKQGNELLCNPPDRGTGPLSWDTGYEYVDGFLWFNNVGDSDGSCGAGDPSIATFWPAYAVSMVQHGTRAVTGPRYDLLFSQTDM
ncbi:MAG: glycoside hydrolase family 6 protein [Solirubrobacteraceae bacterium]